MTTSAYETIAFHARANPDALAVHHSGLFETYASLIADVEDTCRELAALGVDATHPVGLELPSGYHHLVVLLATLRLGIPTASMVDGYLQRAGTARFRELGFGTVLTRRPDARHDGVRTVMLGGRWRDSRKSRPGDPVPAAASDAAGLRRVIFSSGTTGTPKGVPFEADLLCARLLDSVRWYDFSSSARVICMLDFASGPGYWWPLATLAAGGVLFLPPADADQDRLFEFAESVSITHMLTSPAILDRLLRKHARPLPALRRLEAFGSHFPPALARMARRRVTPNVYFQYGATEVGSVSSGRVSSALADAGASGYVRPDFRVEVVDDAGAPLPAGSVGRIRIASRTMARGYLGEKTSTTLTPEGFYPGDVGVLDAAGMLTVHGRGDELINVGGLKIAPHVLENHAREFPGVTDVAAFAMTNARGVDEAWIAVTADGVVDAAKALAFVRGRAGLPVAGVVQAPRIPRNANGKILRRELTARRRGDRQQ